MKSCKKIFRFLMFYLKWLVINYEDELPIKILFNKKHIISCFPSTKLCGQINALKAGQQCFTLQWDDSIGRLRKYNTYEIFIKNSFKFFEGKTKKRREPNRSYASGSERRSNCDIIRDIATEIDVLRRFLDCRNVKQRIGMHNSIMTDIERTQLIQKCARMDKTVVIQNHHACRT